MITGTSEIINETGSVLDLTDKVTNELKESFDKQLSQFDYLPSELLAHLLKLKLEQITGGMT
ncbi:hypothetical protein MUA03_07855 [Enterobacteriaceae bacterium H16N7]|nr:hypothetical protein [Dryocola clanedunensis]